MSDPRALWRGAPFAAKAFVISTAGWLALMAAVQLPWAETTRNFRQRRTENAALASILAEAKSLNLTFPQVVVAHPAYVGKPVYWAVNVVSTSTTQVDEHPTWRVIWNNPRRVEAERIYMDAVLARVTAVGDDAVYLDYLGRP